MRIHNEQFSVVEKEKARLTRAENLYSERKMKYKGLFLKPHQRHLTSENFFLRQIGSC